MWVQTPHSPFILWSHFLSKLTANWAFHTPHLWSTSLLTFLVKVNTAFVVSTGHMHAHTCTHTKCMRAQTDRQTDRHTHTHTHTHMRACMQWRTHMHAHTSTTKNQKKTEIEAWLWVGCQTQIITLNCSLCRMVDYTAWCLPMATGQQHKKPASGGYNLWQRDIAQLSAGPESKVLIMCL